MVNYLVERATSDMLIGPDWAMNLEICDMLNHDPGLTKDVVKGVKKRIGSKNSKVQLLALTLLETLVKNCSDIVHMHVAEKDVLHEMVKVSRKKPDFQVKEKILVLIDTWKEAFGGPRARYPQYFAAYQELLRAGAIFPQRSESSAPIFTPLQTQSLTSYPRNMKNHNKREDATEPTTESEFPTLSLTEIQNARGIMDVLAEMLNALDPENKEGLRQDVMVDMVDQCRTYKQRVVHLVNSTSDESLLCQGLALNDDLQRLLAKHEALASRTYAPKGKPKSEPSKTLVDMDIPLVDTEDSSRHPDASSTSISGAAKEIPKIDLLSGYQSPKADNSLALVPFGELQPSTSTSQQNSLILFDMPPNPITHSANPSEQISPLGPQIQQHQNFTSQQGGLYTNDPQNIGSPQYSYTQSTNPWNSQIMPHQQPVSPAYGDQNSGALPPPPWEAQATDGSSVAGSQFHHPMQLSNIDGAHAHQFQNGLIPQGSQHMGNDQALSVYYQPNQGGQYSTMNQNDQFVGMSQLPPQIQIVQYLGAPPQQMQLAGQMPNTYPQQMYSNHQVPGYNYGYNQRQGDQFLDQRMYGLSTRDDNGSSHSSYQLTASPHVPLIKPAKPEDKFFGDLVNMAKVKSQKPASGTG